MPFLCCFPRNPFVKRKVKTQDIPAPRMVQLPQQQAPPVTASRIPKRRLPNPNQIEDMLAQNQPLKCRALNPNQRYPFPSQAPSPPPASPTTSEQAIPAHHRKRGQYRPSDMNRGIWIDRDEYISSNSIGSAALGVPPQAQSDRIRDCRPLTKFGRQSRGYYSDTATGGSPHNRVAGSTPAQQRQHRTG